MTMVNYSPCACIICAPPSLGDSLFFRVRRLAEPDTGITDYTIGKVGDITLPFAAGNLSPVRRSTFLKRTSYTLSRDCRSRGSNYVSFAVNFVSVLTNSPA